MSLPADRSQRGTDAPPVRRIIDSADEPIDLESVDELSDVRPDATESRSQLTEGQRVAGADELIKHTETREGEPALAENGFESRLQRVCGVDEREHKRPLSATDGLIHTLKDIAPWPEKRGLSGAIC